MTDSAPVSPVSRETAAGFPPDRASQVARYVDLLGTTAVERGLIGPREQDRIWDRHVLNCVAISAEVPIGSSLADLGAGAGLPGVVLALARPDLHVTLIEPLARRARFLGEVVAELGLDDVDVLQARAESLHGRRVFDIVTARAVAPLIRLLGWAMPLVAPAGALVAMKGSSAAAEIRDAHAELRRLACDEPEIRVLTAPTGSSTATVVRVAHARPTRLG